jgi:hypothetical protein
MDYYLLSQDTRIEDYAEPIGLSKIFSPKSMNHRERFLALKEEVLQFYSRGTDEYLDYIERPVLLVSDRLKETLECCEKRILYKLVILTDLQQFKQTKYWLMAPEAISCLAPETEWHKNGTVKKLVLDLSLIGRYKVFQIADAVEHYLVVDADVAEYVLRLHPRGMRFTRIELNG